MAEISRLRELVNGINRGIDLAANTLVVLDIKIGGAAGTTFNQTQLDSLLAHIDGVVEAKHTANQIDYERVDGSRKNIQADATSGDVEAALSDLDDAIGALAASPSNYTPSDAAIVADHLAGIDSALATYLPLAGGTLSGALDMGSNQINNLAAPVAASDAARLQDVQTAQAGINAKDAVRVATTADLSATFNSSGGANSLGQFTGAPTTIDGVALAQGDRVLVKDQSSALENGIYVVTATTSVWDRADDFDGSPANEVKGGNLVFVDQGTANADTQFILEGAADEKTVNTDALNWTIFTRLEALQGGDGLTKTGNVLSVNVDGVTLEIVSDDLQIADLGVSTAKLAATSVTAAKLGSDVAGAGLTGGNGSALAVDFASTFTIDSADALAIQASVLASTANGEGASIIGIEDSAANFASDDVEGALVEVANRLTAVEGGSSILSEELVAGESLAANTVAVIRFGVVAQSETAGRAYLGEIDTATFDQFHVIGVAYPSALVSAGGNVEVVKRGLLDIGTHGFPVGEPVWLAASGALTGGYTAAPSTAGQAVVRVGVVRSSTEIEVMPEIQGVV